MDSSVITLVHKYLHLKLCLRAKNLILLFTITNSLPIPSLTDIHLLERFLNRYRECKTLLFSKYVSTVRYLPYLLQYYLFSLMYKVSLLNIRILTIRESFQPSGLLL